MPDAFNEFFSQNPFWAIVLVILMGLPILGAIAWVIARVFKRPEDENNQYK